MSKLTQDEYLEGIRNIIKENMSDEPDRIGSDKFVISRHIAALIESGQQDPKLMDYLISWNDVVKANPGKEFTLYENFGKGLTQFQKGNAEVKKVLREMNEMLNNFGDEYVIFNLIEQFNDPAIQEAVKVTYNNYLEEPTEDTRKDVMEALWPEYEKANPVALKLIEALSDEDSIRRREIAKLDESNIYDNINKRIAKQREERKIKRTQQKIEEYAKQVFENAKQEKLNEKLKYNFGTIINNNGINLSEAIKSIASSDAKSNKKLMSIIEQYAGAINTGLYEERLYETFLHKMSAFDYLMPVEEAVKKINEAVKKNAVSIEITKLMEEMAESTSAYLLPLIEEDCARYVKEPTPINRVQVRNCLISFAHDPYCYKILETIDRDHSKEANSLQEKALSVKDSIKFIKEHATVTDLYSPVQYIKEGESVFYTNGQYFVRKGKVIQKLSMEGISQLSEKFTTLCKLVNDPQVQIFEDHILLTGDDKVARIYEGYVDINGNRESTSTLRNLQEMCMKYDYDTNFFIMASCLHENFNKIAKIDFAKHIYLNENAGLNVDLFRIGEQIFINTVNEDANVSTFYHNVNPIQCKNIINGHMGINVSSLFESLLPSQNKLIMRLNETKDEYQAAIDKLESTVDKLKTAKEKCKDESSIKKIDSGIEKAEEQLKDLKSEYKEWQKKVAETTGEEPVEDEEDTKDDVDFDDEEVNDDGDVKKETTNEPLDDKDVDAAMGDLTSPINSETSDSDEDDDFNLSDEEFDSFFDNEEGNEETTEEPNDTVSDEDTVDDMEGEETSDEEIDSDIEDAVEDEISGDDTEVAPDEELSTEDEIGSELDNIASDEENQEEDGMSDESEPVESGDEDMGFDEVDLGDEETSDEEPVIDDSDEDIITNNDINPDEATDAFGGDVNADITADEELPTPCIESDTMIAKITDVMFDENVKTGIKYRTGSVNAIVPMVDRDGKMYNSNQSYTFYLDDEGNPIIDNDEMPYSLYNAIITNIKANPSYETFKAEGVAQDDETRKAAQPVDTTADITDDIKSSEYSDENFSSTDDFDNDTESDYFETEDKPDEFSISLKDDFEDIPDIDFNDAASNFEETPDNKGVPPIPTYKVDDTEIELPAANVDGSEIPESKKHITKKPAVNESKKSAIKGIGSVLNRNKKGTRFFVNEDTAKSSKSLSRYGSKLIREKFSGATDNNKGLLIEEYSAEYDNEYLFALWEFANKIAHNAGNSGYSFKVSDIIPFSIPEEFNTYSFNIVANNIENKVNSFTVYTLENSCYFRPTWEFKQICKDFDDEVPGQLISGLMHEYYNDKPMESVSVNSLSDGKFMINFVMNSLVNDNIELNEKAKIRKTKLSTDNDVKNSKLVDDILYGDKDQRDFEEKVEKETKAAGIENPLAPSSPPAEESVKPKLPNVHRMTLDEARNYEIIYEPNDRVLYNKQKAEVISVSEDGKSVTINLKDKKVNAQPSDLEPDPDYVNDLEVSDTDKEKSLISDPKDNDKLKDLNKKTIDCNIVVDGQKVNITECSAVLDDIINSKRRIRIVNEYGDITEYDNKDVEFTEWPYAVITNSEGEPLRKIQINPQSYINAAEDDYVDCICGGKQTQFIKKVISVLS